MPSRAYTSFLPTEMVNVAAVKDAGVNALSGLYLISTVFMAWRDPSQDNKCQCPLGLIPHFYGTPSKT